MHYVQIYRNIFMQNKAFFLDRDGTINLDIGYLHQPSKVKLLPNVDKAIKLMHDYNYLVVVISNQGGLDKNLFTLDDLIKTNIEIQNQLQLYDIIAKLDYFYFCSHHPSITPNCICRKPKPYLIQKACEQLDIDVTQSFMIGDKLSDVQCGNNANCKNSFLIDKNNTLYDITRNLLK